jgi:hypothetical protein
MPFREFPKNSRETIRVTPTIYEGHDLIDIRVYAPNYETKEMGPTKKGISLNVDTVPELLDALLWALGQACGAKPDASEQQLAPSDAERLANAAWQALRKHGSAVHWDSAEKLVFAQVQGFSKWDLHHVLATRHDLFERVDRACYRARKQHGAS